MFSSDTVTASVFQGAGGEEVEIELTAAVARVLAADTVAARPASVANVALLNEALARQFGYLSFADRPRLRLVYTLPLRPQLP